MAKDFLAQDLANACNVCYELNDVRPIPRTPEQRQQSTPVLLTGLFFLVNQHPDGFSCMVSYDAGRFGADEVESFVEGWMDMWVL